MKFWNFRNKSDSAEDIELRISGDIIDDDNAWLYEWLGIPGASPNAFRNELAQYAGKNISVWVDSYGGSVFAATGIYNALMEHKNTSAKVTTVIDSKAMSAATIPCMAGDSRKISPGGVFMLHNPLTYASGYATDLRKAADVLDVVKETIINAYQLATGMDREKISSLMDGETYMSAQTAIEQGFATEMLYAKQQDPSLSPEMITNFSFNRLSIQNAANDSMKNFFEVAKKIAATQKPLAIPAKNKQNRKEDNGVPINNPEDLRKEYPDFINQIILQSNTEAIKAERDRITALDALDDPQNAAVHDIINEAKVQGKTAEEIMSIVDIVKKHAPVVNEPSNSAQNFMKKALADNKASGVDGIKATGGNGGGDDRQEKVEAINFMVDVMNKKNGRDK